MISAIIKLLAGAFFSAGFEWISSRLDKWRQARAEAKAARTAAELEEAKKNVTVLKAKEVVDRAVAVDAAVVRRDPDQRDPTADKTA